MQPELNLSVATESSNMNPLIVSAVDEVTEKRFKLTDVGKKIGGAKKDIWGSRCLTVSDLSDMNDREAYKYVVKSRIWPTPDYKKLKGEGAEAKAVFLIKKLKDKIYLKALDNREVYISSIEKIRDALTGLKTVDAVKNAIKNLYDACFLPETENGKILKRATPEGREFKDTIGWKAFYFMNDIEYESRKLSSRDDDNVWGLIIKERTNKEKREGDKLIPVRPQLAHIVRDGVDYRNGKDVTGDDLLNTFGFRGIEFGNYTNQQDRQQSLNHAYDALMDLAGIMKIHPSKVSLNGTLGLAFGARGSGKHAAHYEPTKVVINLTKMSGAGSLAHEWGHALDDYLCGLCGSKSDGRYYLSQSYIDSVRDIPFTGFRKVMTAFYRKDEPNDDAVKRIEGDIRRVTSNIGGWWRRIRENYLKGFGGVIDKKLENFNFPSDSSILELLDNIQAISNEKSGRKVLRQDINGLYGNLSAKRRYLSKLSDINNGRGITETVGTSYFIGAKRLDSNKSKKYWSNPQELFARAFESYISDRLNGKSDYLVHGAKGDTFSGDNYRGNPYPAGAERDNINAAFDAFVDTFSKEFLLK